MQPPWPRGLIIGDLRDCDGQVGINVNMDDSDDMMEMYDGSTESDDESVRTPFIDSYESLVPDSSYTTH